MHLYINDIPIIFAECKTYLDKCYLDRANSDLFHLRKINDNIRCIIVSLENAVSTNAENYFKDLGNIDKIFYLVDGKRSSKKPVWKKEYYKPINKIVLNNLINYISESIRQYI